MALTAKEAISRAFDVAREYENFLAPEKGLKNLRLEAVELSSDEQEWHITLGFDTGKVRTTQTAGNLAMVPQTTREEEREFKTIILDQLGHFKKIEMH